MQGKSLVDPALLGPSGHLSDVMHIDIGILIIGASLVSEWSEWLWSAVAEPAASAMPHLY